MGWYGLCMGWYGVVWVGMGWYGMVWVGMGCGFQARDAKNFHSARCDQLHGYLSAPAEVV